MALHELILRVQFKGPPEFDPETMRERIERAMPELTVVLEHTRYAAATEEMPDWFFEASGKR